jgi:hypothetical protein
MRGLFAACLVMLCGHSHGHGIIDTHNSPALANSFPSAFPQQQLELQSPHAARLMENQITKALDSPNPLNTNNHNSNDNHNLDSVSSKPPIAVSSFAQIVSSLASGLSRWRGDAKSSLVITFILGSALVIGMSEEQKTAMFLFLAFYYVVMNQ